MPSVRVNLSKFLVRMHAAFIHRSSSSSNQALGSSLVVFAALALLYSQAEAQNKNDDRTLEPYASCLISQARKGTYRANDGGRSAVRLMANCDSWKAYVDHCVATSQALHTRADCQLQAGILAQSALELRDLGLR